MVCCSGSSAGKEFTCNAGGLGLIPGLGRSPGEGKSFPLQYSDPENFKDCIVHGVAKGRTRLNDFHFLSFLLQLNSSNKTKYEYIHTWETITTIKIMNTSTALQIFLHLIVFPPMQPVCELKSGHLCKILISELQDWVWASHLSSLCLNFPIKVKRES